MIEKKRQMIKNNAQHFWFRLEKAIQLVGVALAASSVYFLCDFLAFLGFVVGVLAFWLSFISIERILIRVFGFQDIRKGVLRSGMWVFLKFFGPMGLIWVGISHDAAPVWVFWGLCYGLASVAANLFIRDRFSVNSVE